MIIDKYESLAVRLLWSQELTAMEWGGELIHLRNIFSQAFAQYLEGNALIWVVDLSGVGIIAQAIVQLKGQRGELADGIARAYLYGFRVRSPYRGQGVGTRLILTIEDDLLKRGYRVVTLTVAQDNVSALRLYTRLGYRIISPEAGRWSYIDHLGRLVNVDEPSWLMEKVLRIC